WPANFGLQYIIDCTSKSWERHPVGSKNSNRHLFIAGLDLALDTISPVVEILDFRNEAHIEIATYLQRYQTVASRKLVGRRSGLLVYDAGQTTLSACSRARRTGYARPGWR